MFSTIYIEEEVRKSARVLEILEQLPATSTVEIGQYGEIFNRNNQNFRLQKQNPALILAHKHGKLVLPTPSGYGFEKESQSEGFYFSHMLNCIYDCRYCFLQGMFRSANTVLFVNYEDFELELESAMAASPAGSVFYSGYDCDSLALEPVSQFISFFLPLFERHPDKILEIRTKSTQVRCLLDRPALANCVVAMSFSPEHQSKEFEHKVPSIQKRLESLARLQAAGWPVALRFEPVIAVADTFRHYQELFELVFSQLNGTQIHSASIGEYRMPTEFYKRIVRLYPDDKLLAREIHNESGMVSLALAKEELLIELERLLLQYVDANRYYRCA